MAATALLSSPRATTSATTTTGVGVPPSRIITSPSSPSRSKNNRLSAAADLIRNLDAALSGMTAAATSAAEDAARARRNAKVAGEVARRYGGSSAVNGKGSGRKKKGEKNANESLLERKRERRAAARMAAEARQRREHPMPSTPRRTPRSSRGIGGFWGSGGTSIAVDTEFVQDRVATHPAPAREGTKLETIDTNAVNNNEAAQKLFSGITKSCSTPLGTTEVREAATAASTRAVQKEESIATLDTNFTDFEDAMEHHHDAEEIQYQQAAEAPPVEGAPPANDHYMQQNSHYNQQQYQQEQQQPYYQSDQGQQDTEYYNQNQHEQYYAQPQQQPPYSDPSLEQQSQHWPQAQQPPSSAPSLTVAVSHDVGVSQPSPKHSIPPTPPRSQPTSTNRIEASHAEDVLTLSLELERVRSQLASTAWHLSDATSQVTTLQTQNDHLNSELSTLHSQLETTNERSSIQLSSVQEQLEAEQLRSKAAEEDAALALELAKEAQLTKEECEMWLSRSLEEIDLWRGRVGGLERQLKEQQELQLQQQQKAEEAATVQAAEEEEEEPKKLVRFKQDCPPSPVRSEDGSYEEDAVNATPPVPPPPPPPVWSTPSKNDVSHNDDAAVTNNAASPIIANNGTDGIHSGIHTGIFSPTNISSNADIETPSKSDMVASGRAVLHRASPSPRNNRNGLSPHPRMQASDLLKKSAETRRLLRERLTPGYNGSLQRPPMSNSKMPRPSSETSLHENDTFASRQGATCKAIGRTIRESGARLKLDGKWWDTFMLTNGNGSSPASEPVIEGVAQLESMVKGYCGGVEGTIGQQREKIDELLAFCDHLEKEVMLDRE